MPDDIEDQLDSTEGRSPASVEGPENTVFMATRSPDSARSAPDPYKRACARRPIGRNAITALAHGSAAMSAATTIFTPSKNEAFGEAPMES